MRLATALFVIAATLVVWPGSVHAGPSVVLSFDPEPAPAGTTVSVTVTNYGPCNNVQAAPSFIRLLDPPNPNIDGSFPGGTSTGTLDLPSSLPPGDYTVQVQCTISQGNSVFRTGTLTVTDQLPSTTTTTTTSEPGSATSTTGATASPSATPAAVVATRPTFTG
jgi:hypothetical protein